VLDFQNREPSKFINGRARFDEMPDSHSVAIVCSNHGYPLYHVKLGKYEVHGTNPQVNPEPLQRYKEAVDKLLVTL